MFALNPYYNIKLVVLVNIIVLAAAKKSNQEEVDVFSFEFDDDEFLANGTENMNEKLVTTMDTTVEIESENENDAVDSIDSHINQIMFKMRCRELLPGYMPLLNRKIVNGLRVTIKEHPYIVSIKRQLSHYLTGTMLTRNTIISAAHPLIDVPIIELTAVAGENYADRGAAAMTVIIIIFHQDFDSFTLRADLALLRVYEAMPLKPSVKPILGLVGPRYDLNDTTGFVSGWGRCDVTGKELCLPRSSIFYPQEYLDPMLRTIPINIKNDTELFLGCKCYNRLYDLNIDEGMICLGKVRLLNINAPCLAVPGAPLVVQGLLAGIQSWGLGCGHKHDLPLIYVDIRKYYDWILYNTEVLEQVHRKDYRKLYRVTKALQYCRWMSETHDIMKMMNPRDELITQDIDKTLARVNGTVMDVRNFAHEGFFTDAKNRMYEGIQSSLGRYDYLVREKSTTRVPLPFLSHKKYTDENDAYEYWDSNADTVHSGEELINLIPMKQTESQEGEM